MKETSNLTYDLNLAIMKINAAGTHFKPNIAMLIVEINRTKNYGGTVILPSNNKNGFETVRYAKSEADIKDNSVTTENLWECAKEHYGLTAAATVAGAASIPIKKVTLGYKVIPRSSPYTNLTSHYGLKFFPRTNFRAGSVTAKASKRVFGTIRVFGMIGRALPFAAVGLAVFDAISIGQCVYKKNK